MLRRLVQLRHRRGHAVSGRRLHLVDGHRQRVATDRLQETKQTVEEVAQATSRKRRRLPRVQVTIS